MYRGHTSLLGITLGKPNYSVTSEDLAKQVTRHLTPLPSAFISPGKVLFIRFLRVIYQIRQLRGRITPRLGGSVVLD